MDGRASSDDPIAGVSRAEPLPRYPYSASNRLFQLKWVPIFTVDGVVSALMERSHTIDYTKKIFHRAALNSIQSTFIRSEVDAIKTQCRSHSDLAELTRPPGVQIYGTAGRTLAQNLLPAAINSVGRESRMTELTGIRIGWPAARGALRTARRHAERG